jgi:hypothetical protein
VCRGVPPGVPKMTDRANPTQHRFIDPDNQRETLQWDRCDCPVNPISARAAIYIIAVIVIAYIALKFTFPQYIA